MSASEPLDLYCLCAAWCGTCRGYEQILADAVAGRAGVRVHWVDIEDEAESVGDVDIQTFPTLLLAQGDRVRFFGPVLPNESAARQVLERGHEWRVSDAEAEGLARRLRALSSER